MIFRGTAKLHGLTTSREDFERCAEALADARVERMAGLREMAAAPDNHTSVAHIHVDHVFLAWAADGALTSEPAHQVRWCTAVDLAQAPDVAEDSRSQAVDLMQR
ncbi:hypothetical protein [Sphaerisporangium fuscum]|uniref:hypothetical protein n=1 Tax=Sphaerisporangium fuscum TaxID=2835868 RepID=UPI001BDBEFEF|nr:hypothetical protein [Sphaerisporangium fuscum]